MKLVMGIDIGTTAIKVIVLNVISSSVTDTVLIKSMPHDLLSINPNWAEEDPNIWREHLYSLLALISKEIDTNQISAIGLTGMVPALILLDKENNPIRNSIQQNDMRTSKEIEELKSAFETDESYFNLTGSHINSQHIAPRLLWLKRNEEENYNKVSHILGSYDYAAYLLTGNLGIESNWALESGLFSLQGDLIPSLLEYVSISKSVLPGIRKHNDICGYITDDVSRITGIPSGVPVYAGTADHVASAFCTGALEHGDLVLKLGGAGDILISLDHLITDDRLFIDYFVSSKCPYILNGCTAASGSLLKWFVKEFGGDFKELDEASKDIAPGSDGLVILPYVLGEKTPIFDPQAKGIIYGLMLSHTKAHIYRAMMESVAYALRHHIEVFESNGIRINNVYITNGGSTSPLWRQIMADVMGYEVKYIKTNPGSCLGAAFIAGIASGLFNEEVVRSFTKQMIPSFPNLDNKRIYDKSYKIYRELYPRVKDLFRAE